MEDFNWMQAGSGQACRCQTPECGWSKCHPSSQRRRSIPKTSPVKFGCRLLHTNIPFLEKAWTPLWIRQNCRSGWSTWAWVWVGLWQRSAKVLPSISSGPKHCLAMHRDEFFGWQVVLKLGCLSPNRLQYLHMPSPAWSEPDFWNFPSNRNPILLNSVAPSAV